MLSSSNSNSFYDNLHENIIIIISLHITGKMSKKCFLIIINDYFYAHVYSISYTVWKKRANERISLTLDNNKFNL
jgi:hypothetical protein